MDGPVISAVRACALAMAVSACVVGSPEEKLERPDVSLIVVYYPVDGRVLGRGSPGSLPKGTPWVYVAPHPTSKSKTIRVEADGSFEFEVRAPSSSVVEIAPASESNGLERGTPVFVHVPRSPGFGEDYYCCKNPGAATGKCVRFSEEKPACEANLGSEYSCGSHAECGEHSYPRRSIDFPLDALELGRPDASGYTRIRARPGKLPPLMLIRVENRAQSAVGGRSSGLGHTQITDERGVIDFRLAARGDDELVFEIHRLDGERSLQHAVHVPDSEFGGVDIVGAFPFDQLYPGASGTVALRFSPFGVDGHGICPDSENAAALCWSGGLDYPMVTLDEVVVSGQRVEPIRTSTRGDLPYTRATDGDVLGGPQALALLIDTSLAAQTSDPEGKRFDAALDFVNALRQRDVLSVYSVGGNAPFAAEGCGTHGCPSSDKAGLVELVKGLQARSTPGSAESDMFGAIRAAADRLRTVPVEKNVRIVAVAASVPSGPYEAGVEAVNAVVGDGEAGPARTVATHIVSVGLRRSAHHNSLSNISLQSRGIWLDVTEPRAMIVSMADVIGAVSGAYLLLYDVPIPRESGKVAQIEIRATLRLPTGLAGAAESKEAPRFSGSLEVRGAP